MRAGEFKFQIKEGEEINADLKAYLKNGMVIGFEFQKKVQIAPDDGIYNAAHYCGNDCVL